MKRITLILSFLIFIACEQKDIPKEIIQLQETQADSLTSILNLTDTSKEINSEYLDWNLMKIQGKLPLVCKQKDLYKLLGQPDSIVNPNLENICISYYDNNFKYAYFGEGIFEIHEDSAAIRIIDFDKIELEYNNRELVLNNSTTIESLERLFPNAIKSRKEVNIHDMDKAICIRIPTSKQLKDDAWLLFFVDGKLKRIDYWMPC